MLRNITLMTTTKPAYQAASSSDKITLNTADTIYVEKSEKLKHMPQLTPKPVSHINLGTPD